ncbi:MAG: YciI family protein [Thermomicrobiales bacterium]
MDYVIFVIDDGQAQAVGANAAAEAEMAAVDVFNDRLRAEGYWVYANGLADPATATVIDNRGAEPVITDGPFLESKEFIGGFWIINAPNLDVALRLAAEGSKACNRKVEVRPFAIEPA